MIMNSLLYYILCGVLTLGVLLGIWLMSKVKSSVAGNRSARRARPARSC